VSECRPDSLDCVPAAYRKSLHMLMAYVLNVADLNLYINNFLFNNNYDCN
jgi:hypothetical protein